MRVALPGNGEAHLASVLTILLCNGNFCVAFSAPLCRLPPHAPRPCRARSGAELYGKVLRVNAAKPMKHKLGAHTAGDVTVFSHASLVASFAAAAETAPYLNFLGPALTTVCTRQRTSARQLTLMGAV